MNINTLVDNGPVCEQEMKQIRTPSILDNLKRRKVQKEDELSRINAAIEGLEANPSVASVLELIAKA